MTVALLALASLLALGQAVLREVVILRVQRTGRFEALGRPRHLMWIDALPLRVARLEGATQQERRLFTAYRASWIGAWLTYAALLYLLISSQ